MCSGALVIARIGKVYYGLPDPRMGGLGGAIDLSALPDSNHNFEFASGVLQKLNHGILKAFFKKKRLEANITKKAGSLKKNTLTTAEAHD